MIVATCINRDALLFTLNTAHFDRFIELGLKLYLYCTLMKNRVPLRVDFPPLIRIKSRGARVPVYGYCGTARSL